MPYRHMLSIRNQVIKLYQLKDWKILPNHPFYLTEWVVSAELRGLPIALLFSSKVDK